MLRKLECWIFGHRYEVWQELTRWSRRVICTHCGSDWGMNDDVQSLIPWGDELEDLYHTMGIRLRPRMTARDAAGKPTSSA